MKSALTLAMLLCLAMHAGSETRVMPPATPEGMVGVWEALIPDGGSMVVGVLEMVVSPQGDAKLIEMYALADGGVLSKFFGSAAPIQLHDGKFTARFSAHPNQQYWTDWMEIEGSAAVDGDIGRITGKVMIHTMDEEPPVSVPMQFRKGHWFSQLATVAAAAEQTIRSPRFINGRAQPDTHEEPHK
jgi:hypothetical protein